MFDFNIKTLRDTLQFKYDIYVNYKELLNYSDIPYEFDRVKKPLWRWHYHTSGAFYSRIHANYSIWFNNHFKKKIGVFMPIYWKIPHKREKVWGPWPKKYYIFENSYINNINNQNNYNYKNLKLYNNNHKNLQYYFYNYNYYKSTIITNYSSLFEHPLIRSYKPFSYFGYENNMLFSGYNYKWHNLYFRDTFYHQFLINPNFVIPVNHFLMSGSFIINSYDSDIILHPYVFLKNDNYIRYFRFSNLLNNFKLIFNKTININFIYNIINLMNKIYKNYINNMLISYNNKFKYLSNEYYIYIIFILYLFKFINIKNNINIYYLNKINNFLNNKLSFFNDNLLFKKLFNNINNIKNNDNIIYHYYFKLINNKYYNYNIYYNYKLLFETKYFNNIYWNRDINSINFWIKNLKILEEKYLSKYLSKYIRKIYYSRIKKLNIIFLNLKKLFILKDNNIYNFFNLKKIIKKINLKVKRYTTYDKIFAIVPYKYKYIYDKSTIILNTKESWNSTLWSKSFNNYSKKIKIFMYKYFDFFTNLFKFNFGFHYNLNYYNNENIKILDMNFFINTQLIIYKYFSWFKYWKKFIYRVSLKKKYSKILYKNIFKNILTYKKKIYKLLNKKKIYYNILKNNNYKLKSYNYIYG